MISVSGFGEILNEFLSYNRLYEICLSLIYQLYSTFDFFFTYVINHISKNILKIKMSDKSILA